MTANVSTQRDRDRVTADNELCANLHRARMQYVGLVRQLENRKLELDKERQQQNYDKQMAENQIQTSFRSIKECKTHVLSLISKLKRVQFDEQKRIFAEQNHEGDVACSKKCNNDDLDVEAEKQRIEERQDREMRFLLGKTAFMDAEPIYDNRLSSANKYSSCDSAINEEVKEVTMNKRKSSQINENRADMLRRRLKACEEELRKRTDNCLHEGVCFELLSESRREMAQLKDQSIQNENKQRNQIAMKSMRELNELVNQRKLLQLQAFRLTELFRQHVDKMTLNKVKDIFIEQERRAQLN